jgi:hypothetical protein
MNSVLKMVYDIHFHRESPYLFHVQVNVRVSRVCMAVNGIDSVFADNSWSQGGSNFIGSI